MNIAAIHLTTASSQIGSPVLAASVLIFGGTKAREDFVVSNWREIMDEYTNDDFYDTTVRAVEYLVSAGAEIIPQNMIASRVVGCQARNLCEGTLWNNHFQSHVSHYAYLFALTWQKRDVMLKGFNMDGYSLNAANRFVAEHDTSYPTGASTPDAGLFYLKKLYIAAKKLLGHDIDSDGAKVLKESAPRLAKAVALPPLPMNNLTLPPLPTNLPPLPGL